MNDGGGIDETPKGPKEPVGLLDNSLMEKLEEGTGKLSISFGSRIEEGDPGIFKAAITLGKQYIPNTYIDTESPMNVISLPMYNKIFGKNLNHEGFHFVGTARRTPIMVGKLIYDIDLIVVNDIESIVNPTLTNLVLGEPFVRDTGMTVNETDGSIVKPENFKLNKYPKYPSNF